jgi:hypothetical protein
MSATKAENTEVPILIPECHPEDALWFSVSNPERWIAKFRMPRPEELHIPSWWPFGIARYMPL